MANSEKSSKDSPEKSSEQVGVTVPDAKEMLKLFKAFDAETGIGSILSDMSIGTCGARPRWVVLTPARS